MKNFNSQKFVEKFIDEAQHLLNDMESKLLELEQYPTNRDHVEAIFRAMHTLKGIGSMFGFTVISEFTHHLESIFDKIRNGSKALSKNVFEVSYLSVDHLRNLLSNPEFNNEGLIRHHEVLTSKVIDLTLTENEDLPGIKTENQTIEIAAESGLYTWYIQFLCSEELIRRAINILILFQDLAKLGNISVFRLEQTTISENELDENWGILLTSNASYGDIEEVFMFALDFVKIIRLENSELKDEQLNYTSISETDIEKTSIAELAENIEKSAFSIQDVKEPIESMKNDVPKSKQSMKIPRISVGSDKLDKLMYLVSELFTVRSELMNAVKHSDLSQVKISSEKIDKLSSMFRANALSIRLVPLQELTLRFNRLIRDLGNQLGKKIEFEVNGDETELDKNLVDRLADPIMHIIRNSIDHGIETPENRLKHGKSEAGKIVFNAYQSGNFIFIQVSDDGNGIDSDYILKKAIEKKFILGSNSLSEKEILELIFLPGFSTAQSLTQVSGRGVGMYVVRRTIAELRGNIEIDTTKGVGTTFTIKLQQTISIMDTLLVCAGDSYFTILLEEVELCGLEFSSVIHDRQNHHIVFSGDLIPYISLRDIFSISGNSPDTERIIMVRRQDTKYAIIVDRIIGQYQAVLKPMGYMLSNHSCVSGASIIGDGNIAFMLDTQKLAKKIVSETIQ